MISRKEILNGTFLPQRLEENFDILHYKVNLLRRFYGKPMYVSSGFRSIEDHYRIYAAKGIPKESVPMGSKHLDCLAVDFADPDNMLKHWIINNISIVESIGLYLEDISWTDGWVHIQVVPPKSGKRFFIP